MIEKGIYQLLAEESTITNLVGQARAGSPCIFWSLQPQGTPLPALIMTVVYTSDLYSMKGASGFRIKRFQFDSYATTVYDAIALSDAVRKTLQSFSGTLDDDTVVQGCIIHNDMDFPASISGVKGPAVYRRLLEIDVQYTE